MANSITIAPYRPENHDQLVDIWLRAVQATHHFLTEEDISFYHQLVRNGVLTTPGIDLWMAVDKDEQPLGFIGLADTKVEMLFVDPIWHSHGIGRQLLNYAADLRGELTLDVNEQNAKAVHFYKRYGFEQTGRSALDTTGRPFPLVHLRLRHAPHR